MSDLHVSPSPARPLSPSSESSRRDFLKGTGTIIAAGALAGAIVPRVHAAEDNTVRVALVGCGGRGTGAAANALSVKNGPIKLTAMADVFDHRLKTSHESLKGKYNDQVEVPEDHKFIGFEAYKQAMDTPASPATWPSSPRPPRFAGSISPMPSKRGSTSSWRSRSPSMALRAGGCSSWAKQPPKKNLKVASA